MLTLFFPFFFHAGITRSCVENSIHKNFCFISKPHLPWQLSTLYYQVQTSTNIITAHNTAVNATDPETGQKIHTCVYILKPAKQLISAASMYAKHFAFKRLYTIPIGLGFMYRPWTQIWIRVLRFSSVNDWSFASLKKPLGVSSPAVEHGKIF